MYDLTDNYGYFGERFVINDKSERRILNTVGNMLIELGIMPKLNGYAYVCNAILLILRNHDYVKKVTTALYPTIAVKYSVRSHSVERAIRHAIENSVNSGKMYRINKLLGVNVYDASFRMTNGEFLSLLSEKIISVSMDEDDKFSEQ